MDAVTYVLAVVAVFVQRSVAAPRGESYGLGIPNQRDVTATSGGVAVLSCSLTKSDEDAKIAWIERTRHTLLAVGASIVIRDHRLSSRREEDGRWTLTIDGVRRSDAGRYRCQVNTSPLPVLKEDIFLDVQGCEAGEFTCGFDLCIELRHRCDGFPSCPDGADEKNCSAVDCTGTNVYCGNGRCIPIAYICDGSDDCGNGFDETNCSKPIPARGCFDDEFSCEVGVCIHATQRCNGRPDCENGTDELNCTADPGLSAQPPTKGPSIVEGFLADNSSWSCDGQTRIPRSFWCDSEQDCPNAADERNCTASDCQPETTYCGEGRCVRGARCDGKDDCARTAHPGYDEQNCTRAQCFAGARYCGNGHCVSRYMICDGVDQCGNGFDEKYCDLPVSNSSASVASAQKPTTTLAADISGENSILFRMLNETLMVQKRIALNVWKACRFRFVSRDEMTCRSGMFSCGTVCSPAGSCATQCLDIGKLCDGRQDCPNGNDEESCKTLEDACGRPTA